MVPGLDQADAGEAPVPGPLQHVLHQPPADRAVLRARVDGDRADAGDRRGLPEEVAADHAAVRLGHDRVDVAAREQRRDQLLGRLHGREVAGEAVPAGDRPERRVADRSVARGRRHAGPQSDGHRSFPILSCVGPVDRFRSAETPGQRAPGKTRVLEVPDQRECAGPKPRAARLSPP